MGVQEAGGHVGDGEGAPALEEEEDRGVPVCVAGGLRSVM